MFSIKKFEYQILADNKRISVPLLLTKLLLKEEKLGTNLYLPNLVIFWLFFDDISYKL